MDSLKLKEQIKQGANMIKSGKQAKARIDADKIAQPLMEIVAHVEQKPLKRDTQICITPLNWQDIIELEIRPCQKK